MKPCPAFDGFVKLCPAPDGTCPAPDGSVDKRKADLSTYNAIVAAVAHREFEELELNQYSKAGATVVYDIKGALPKDKVDARL